MVTISSFLDVTNDIRWPPGRWQSAFHQKRLDARSQNRLWAGLGGRSRVRARHQLRPVAPVAKYAAANRCRSARALAAFEMP